MQELTTMFGADGGVYDLPEDKVDAFREKRGGEAAQNFRLPDGREYSIPESKHDRFMEVHPDAVPLRALSFANGQKRMMSNGDVSKFLRSPEYRDGEEFAADREAARQIAAGRVGDDDTPSPALEFAKELGRSWWKNLTFQPETAWREWMDSGSVAADMVKNANAFAGKMAKGAAEIVPVVNSVAGRLVGGRGTAAGRALMDEADAQRAAIDRSINTETPDMGETMNAVNDFTQNTLVTVGKLANPYIAATVIASDSADAADRARDEALKNGASVQKAEALGTAMGMLEAAKGIYLSNSAGGKLLQKPAVQRMMQSFMGKVLGIGGKAAITGGEMAALGGATDIVQQGVEGAENPDLARTVKVSLKDFATGTAFDLVASGVHGAQRAMFHTPPPEGAPVGYVRDLLERPDGRQLVMSANPNAARKMIEARFNGEPITQKMLASLKLPEAVAPTEAERNAIGDAMLADYMSVRDRQMAKATRAEGGRRTDAPTADAADEQRKADLSTTPKEETNEAGNVRDEEPAQPEQGEVVELSKPEAAKPVEAKQPRSEAPAQDNGAVEPQKVATKPSAPSANKSATYDDLLRLNKAVEEAQNKIDATSEPGTKRISDAIKELDDAISGASDNVLMEATRKERGKFSTEGTRIDRKAVAELNRRGYTFGPENGEWAWRKQPASTNSSRPAEPPQTSEKPPVSAPPEAKPTAPAEPAKPVETAPRASDAKPKSNRLRRADGTDPLAEKMPMSKTLRKAVDQISYAIGNRTGTGVITPDEADGIVRGIVEAPGTKHNRFRDFFNPLEKDAAWHESLGLDAESAKNIRDAVGRAKADADLKKWFPQVDSAVKKAKDGKLFRTDAVPLFGKISEGLEKAERMGLSDAAKRLRDATEVIRPVAETVEQGDVGKFNYSAKGQKLNNRLGGTDKRGNKTVSLDTKKGTVDVGTEVGNSDAGGEPNESDNAATKGATGQGVTRGATGQGGSSAGNRHMVVDGVNGNELTVTMKDSAGKTIATRKMTKDQWATLAKAGDATDGDPANPQKGDYLRMSKATGEAAADLPTAWTPETQRPLENFAEKVLKPTGLVKGYEFAPRPENVDGENAIRRKDGTVVGEYDRKTGRAKFFPGARAEDITHEFTHGLFQHAEQEASAGRPQLKQTIDRLIEAMPEVWKDVVGKDYADRPAAEVLEEIFTNGLARLGETGVKGLDAETGEIIPGREGSGAMAKAMRTLEGKAWYNRAWNAIKELYRDFMRRHGWYNARLDNLDRMSPDEAARHILSEMAKGRSFGDVPGAQGEGTRNALMPDTMQKIYSAIKRYKDSGMKFSNFTESIVTMLDRGGRTTIDLPGFQPTPLVIEIPATTQGVTRRLDLDHSAFNHNWENGNAYTGYYTWPEFDRAFRDYNLRNIQKLPNKHNGQELWQWKVKYPKTDAHDSYELTWRIARDEKTGKMLNLFTTRSKDEFPPAQMKMKAPEGEQRNTTHLDDVVASSSSGDSGGSIPQISDGRKGESAVTDAAYMDAVNRGDMETAQKMLERKTSSVYGGDAITSRMIGGKNGDDLAVLYRSYDAGRTSYGPQRRFGVGVFLTDSEHAAELYDVRSGGLDYKPRANRFYATAKNVLEVDADGKYFTDIALPKDLADRLDLREGGSTDEIAAKAFANGYDAVVIRNVKEGLGGNVNDVILKDGNQLKLADPVTYDDAGNVIPLSQRFNQKSNDIRQSRRIVLPSKPTEGVDMNRKETLFERWQRNFHDRFDPIKALQKDVKAAHPEAGDIPDPYYEKRVQAGHNEADHRAIEHISDEYSQFLRDSKGIVTHEEMGKYLKARDALYRNPDMKRRLGVENGAGISEATALKWLQDFAKAGKTPTLKKGFDILQKLKEDFGLQRLVDGGMLDQKTADMLTERNPDYAPQRTDWTQEDGFDRNSNRSVESPAFKKAFGRSSEADDPVTFLFMQAKDTAARTNENRTRQALADLVRQFPELGRVRVQNKASAWDYKNGDMAVVDDPYDREDRNPNIVAFREGGKKYYIELNGARAHRVAEAMRGEGIRRSPEKIAAMTRAFASTATQLSGTFSGRNFLKDLSEVALNVASDKGLMASLGFLKNQTKEIAPTIKALHEYLTKGTFADNEIGRQLERFVNSGSMIGGIGREGYQERLDSFERQQKSIAKRFALSPLREKVNMATDVTFGKVKHVNEVLELITRFNNFRNRVKPGGDVKEATLAAREDSTDFNMYGQQRWLNDVYMFSNSILGGTFHGLKRLGTGKYGRRVAASVVAYGFAETMASILLNDDYDKEAEKSGVGGEKDMSERERAQTLFFRNGDKYYRIPLHGGPYSTLKYAGGNLARAMMGKISWKDALSLTAKEAATTFTHLSGIGEVDFTNGPKGIAESATPSLVRPAVELGVNQDFAGRKIYNEDIYNSGKLRSEQGRDRTGEGYKAFARFMSRLGGDEKNGWLDNPPEVYKHIADSFGKNMLRDLEGAADFAGRTVESIKSRENKYTRDDVPFLRDVTRNVPDSTARYYEAVKEFESEKKRFKEMPRERQIEIHKEKNYLVTGKGTVDNLIERVKDEMHLERGEIKTKSGKWVEPKTPRTDAFKEAHRKRRLELQKRRLELQARVLKILGR